MRENRKYKIIHEDKDKLVIFKPAGMLTQSDKSFDVDLVSEILTLRRKRGEDVYAAVINRLDRPVSGLVLIAKNRKAAARLSKELQKDTLNKKYYAIVCGSPEQKKGTLRDYLKKDGRDNISFVTQENDEAAKEAVLDYEVIKELKYAQGQMVSILQITLHTGRHHQIRVQFASRGLPLLGDTKYGGDIENTVSRNLKKEGIKLIAGRSIALCAYSITVDGEIFEIELSQFYN